MASATTAARRHRTRTPATAWTAAGRVRRLPSTRVGTLDHLPLATLVTLATLDLLPLTTRHAHPRLPQARTVQKTSTTAAPRPRWPPSTASAAAWRVAPSTLTATRRPPRVAPATTAAPTLSRARCAPATTTECNCFPHVHPRTFITGESQPRCHQFTRRGSGECQPLSGRLPRAVATARRCVLASALTWRLPLRPRSATRASRRTSRPAARRTSRAPLPAREV